MQRNVALPVIRSPTLAEIDALVHNALATIPVLKLPPPDIVIACVAVMSGTVTPKKSTVTSSPSFRPEGSYFRRLPSVKSVVETSISAHFRDRDRDVAVKNRTVEIECQPLRIVYGHGCLLLNQLFKSNFINLIDSVQRLVSAFKRRLHVVALRNDRHSHYFYPETSPVKLSRARRTASPMVFASV